MVDKIWLKAKQFMGLEGEGTEDSNTTQDATDNSGGMGGILRFRTPKKTEEALDYEIAICEPKVYEESLSISYKLRQGCPVLINLKFLDQTDGTRLIDFVCGAAYAINGHMMRVGESIFLFTPNNVGIVDIGEKQGPAEGVEISQKDKMFTGR